MAPKQESSTEGSSTKEPAQTGTRLRDVLSMTAAWTAINHRPAHEWDVWLIGRNQGRWEYVGLFGQLKRLTDLGWLERHGPPGGYSYTVTEAGTSRLERA